MMGGHDARLLRRDAQTRCSLRDSSRSLRPRGMAAGQAGLSVRGGGRDHHGGSCSWLAREGAVHGASEVSETDDPVHPVGV